MKYNSLFDPDIGRRAPYFMVWDGTMEDVFKEIIYYSELPANNFLNRQSLILGAPRIIRGVLDYRSKNVEMKEINKVVASATDTALQIYQNPSQAVGAINNFKNILSETDNNLILDWRIFQSKDSQTWESSNPVLSKKSTSGLVNEIQGKDMLFLMIAHGGVMAGLDVFLRYQEITGSENSCAYPIRFSSHKKKDRYPFLDLAEEKYLMEKSKGREVVIFDEDCFRGETMLRFSNFLNGTIFRERKLNLRVNYKKYYGIEEFDEIKKTIKGSEIW